ncbi:MAG TPA: ABC transporter ATP-binding protein, partial [Deltaproteobacteria bacterium]|nr:ABC transporter ATP-binding protein [Deltaproteobacteria bacterium]
RQRISIARSLLANPKILILDDATSAIDVHVERSIHDKLRDLLANRTTMIIAHRLSTIALADRVILIDDGQVVADGKHLDLMRTEPRYAEVLAHFSDEEEEEAAP